MINAIAVHCMVGVAIDSALPLLRGTYPDTPIITLTYGGTEGPSQHVRLETFVHTVLERAKCNGRTSMSSPEPDKHPDRSTNVNLRDSDGP